MANFTADQLIDRVFLRISYVMHSMWEETGSSDTRLLDEPLVPDRYVVVGESRRGTECREHVIPRKVVCEQCHSMFAHGATIEQVAAFLRSYVKVVRISKDERHVLDHGSKLNLRQRMPVGWSFEDGDVFARLALGGIVFSQIGTE